MYKQELESVALESYKTLRTNIEYSSFDEGLKVIIITSAEKGEGKTTVASNLAISLGEDEKKVLLIDCDLRMPNIHKKFLVSNKEGLSEILIGKASLEVAKLNISNNLDVITSGKVPPNPAEMIGSKKMKELIDNAKEEYDYIILDTPPILAVTDAQVLSTKCDGVILVVRAEKTKKDSVLNAKKLLEKVRANIIGTVFNGMEIKEARYYYRQEKRKKVKKVRKVKNTKKELEVKLEN